MIKNEGGTKMPKEWKDNSYFKNRIEDLKKETEEVQKILDNLENKGKIVKEFDKERNDWIYKPLKKEE